VGAAFAHDLIRSVGDGRPWLLMEQAPSAVNWRAVNAPKPPGMMRLWSYQALAHGADSILYFQWRQSRGGAEKFHSAMVPHAGTDSRTHLEVRALGRELERLGELRGAQVNSQAAIVFDWPSWWGLELDSHPSAVIGMHDACLAHYRPLWEEHASVDMVQPGGDLARYRLLVVPNLYMVSDADASRLCDYVRDGGRLLISFFSGIVDVCDRVYLGGYPAPFRRLLGIRIDEFWPLAPGELVELDLQLGDGAPPSSSGTLWSEWIVADSAEVIGRFSSGPLCGRPAVTRHRFGQGVAWYLGTRLDPASMRALVRSVLAESEIRPPLPHVPDGVEVGRRRSDRGTYLFLLNHGQAPASVTVPDGAVALLGTVENGHATLSGLDIAILRLPG
jgi:beta-galactosidase